METNNNKLNDETLLARWLDGSLSDEELKELEHSPEYPTLLRIRTNFSKIQPPRKDDAHILKHILSKPKIKTKRVSLYRKLWIPVAASILALLGLTHYFAMPREFSASNGETYAFVLPDASEVLLNAGSQATYSRWNWADNRTVDLNGEAYFKVAKGKKFKVQTNVGVVTVLGTQFNVKARENRFDVVCYEGKVLVQATNQKIVLTPGQKVSFIGNVSKGLVLTQSVSPEWTREELLFDNETIVAVLSEMERQYAIEIKANLQSSQLFSGSVPGNDLDAALKIIGNTYHLKVQRTENTVVLNPIQ